MHLFTSLHILKDMQNSIFSFLFAILFSLPTFAFRLSPMVIRFSPDGAKATQVLSLENTSMEKVPVQIEAFARATDKDGKEIRTKSDDFVIYPEQLVLLPNEKRNVRVTWNKTEKIDQEKSYRLVASQLPLEFRDQNSKPKPNSANLTFLLQYVASAYVGTAEFLPNIQVESAVLSKPQSLELVLVNNGKAHQVMKVKNLKISSGGKDIEMKHVKELEAENLLVGDKKKYVIVLPQALSGTPKVSLSLEDAID